MGNSARIDEAVFTSKDEDPESERRRRFARYRVDLQVTVTSEHNFYAGFAENLSVGGVFIATHRVRPVGESIEFALTLPDNPEQPLVGLGEVRWVRLYSDTSHAPPGMGIRFVELAAQAQSRIDGFLGSREPLFYDED
jgi:uncharacterized protein (TIGR02266 family)